MAGMDEIERSLLELAAPRSLERKVASNAPAGLPVTR